MNNEMIERVGKAIENSIVNTRLTSTSLVVDYNKAARAAIEAMREYLSKQAWDDNQL